MVRPRGGACATLVVAGLAALAVGSAAVRTAETVGPDVGQTGKSCATLSTFALTGGSVIDARVVPPGTFEAPSGRGNVNVYASLPAFCRVTMTLTPSADSDISSEVWLPLDRWSGRYQAVGNGGWAGNIPYGAMARALARQDVASGTDTGHRGNSAAFALGHPEKLIDYEYRAHHATATAAKALAEAFYGATPRWSYFNGCSTGGRQGLVAAQRYPDDFDGIVAGAPANPKINMDVSRIWMSQTMFRDAASRIPPAKYGAIGAAVRRACDAIDGVTDGLLEDPTRCRFDPGVLQCQGADGPDCLTAPQVESARVLLTTLRDQDTGEEIFPGFEPGSEQGWGALFGGMDAYATAVDTFRYVVFQDPSWNWRTLSPARDLRAAGRLGSSTLSGVDPDLSVFAARGGKLLMYHGWADPNIAPRASVNFYERARRATTPRTSNSDWIRLFMVPGMQHCSGGPGPDTFDAVGALQTWVEDGGVPTSLVASHATNGAIDRTRPLCPYPFVARYGGAGSIDEAANFACVSP